MTNIVRFAIPLLFFLIPIHSNAQEKFEKESRIHDAELIPGKARLFVDSLRQGNRAKWYKEESQTGISVEAKFRLNKRMCSVEFDTLGSLQDVEVVMAKNEVNPILLHAIEVHLDSLFTNWNFQKIQMQYKGVDEDVLKSIKGHKPIGNVSTYYEIVLKGRMNGLKNLYEVTVTDGGEIIYVKEIVDKPAEHLEY
jgi:hypothetical protein